MEKYLNTIIDDIKPLNLESMIVAKRKLDGLTKPVGSLGELEAICIKLAGIYETADLDVSSKCVVAFAGDHGVYEEGVSADPQFITAAQIPNFAKEICAVGTLAKLYGAKIVAVDVGVNTTEVLEGVIDRKIRRGTFNMHKGPAMTRAEAIKSIAIGIETVHNIVISDQIKVVSIGEMGIGNTTPSSAIVSVYGECDPKYVTGKGAGLNTDQIIHKANIIRESIELNLPNKHDPIDVLTKIGGFEIGAMAGAIIGAASKRVPVVLDGFISYAAALIAKGLSEVSTEYMIASHYSAEPGTVKALEILGLTAPIHLDMRLGEGVGGVMFFPILDAGVYLYNNMATREESNC